MAVPEEGELVTAIADATRNAVRKLFGENPNETFYYCSLVTTGEGHTPCFTAWSREKLEEAVRAEGGDEGLRAELKWSYADSPYCCYGEEFFGEVRRLLTLRSDTGDRDSTNDHAEYELRLRAMEAAMARLDTEGLFGAGRERALIVVNAEVMPPDHTNVERALRLNPREGLEEWLAEAAEPA